MKSCINKKLVLQGGVLEKCEANKQRLQAERNIRFFLEYNTFKNCSRRDIEEIDSLIEEGVAKKTSEVYIEQIGVFRGSLDMYLSA